MRAAAKQAQDEESLMRFLANKYVIKSMQPDGDCGYELMCRWKEIHAARKRGYSLSKKIIDEPIPEKEINAMRNAIAAEQERQINQKGNTFLQTLIGQSMLDWSRSPLENNGRNGEVAAAIQARSAGMLETAWANSLQSLALHSSLIRTGKNEVFAESPEMEAFSLLIGSSLALYLPGYCEFYPQSRYSKADTEILVCIEFAVPFYLIAIWLP